MANCLIDRNGMYMLYCYLFLSHLSYCCEMWGTTYTTNIHGITILQKRVIRLVCGVKRLEHTNTLFQQLGDLKFVDLVQLKTAIIMFNAFHNELPSNLQNFFKPYVSVYGTRQNNSSCITRFRTNAKSMCISRYGARLWNSLNENITTCRTKLDIIATY